MAGARRRGDVAADRDRARRPGVAAVRGPLADAGRPGRRRHARAARGVGRARLQPSGPGVARMCADDRRGPRRSRAGDGRRTGCAAGDRALHGASGRGHGLPGPGRAARRQRPASRLAAARRAVVFLGAPGGGRRPGVARSARSLARCRHGSRLGNVHRLARRCARRVPSPTSALRAARSSPSSRKPPPSRSR